MRAPFYGKETETKLNKLYIILLGLLASLGVAFAAKKIYDATQD